MISTKSKITIPTLQYTVIKPPQNPATFPKSCYHHIPPLPIGARMRVFLTSIRGRMSDQTKNDAVDGNQTKVAESSETPVTNLPPPPPLTNQRCPLETPLLAREAPILMSHIEILNTLTAVTNTLRAVTTRMDSMEEVVKKLPKDTRKLPEENSRYQLEDWRNGGKPSYWTFGKH